jgi:hypothetical protein
VADGQVDGGKHAHLRQVGADETTARHAPEHVGVGDAAGEDERPAARERLRDPLQHVAARGEEAAEAGVHARPWERVQLCLERRVGAFVPHQRPDVRHVRVLRQVTGEHGGVVDERQPRGRLGKGIVRCGGSGVEVAERVPVCVRKPPPHRVAQSTEAGELLRRRLESGREVRR